MTVSARIAPFPLARSLIQAAIHKQQSQTHLTDLRGKRQRAGSQEGGDDGRELHGGQTARDV
jgi:hypothetical protein